MPIVVPGAPFFDTFKSSKAIESPIYQGRQYETVVVLFRSIGMKIAEYWICSDFFDARSLFKISSL